MSTGTITAGAAQVVGGVLLAPLLPGLIQHWKARLQGRRGPTPLQPYRELRRLWSKSTVTVEGTTPVYRLAPALVAASAAAAILLVPAAQLAPDWDWDTTRSRWPVSSRWRDSPLPPRRGTSPTASP